MTIIRMTWHIVLLWTRGSKLWWIYTMPNLMGWWFEFLNHNSTTESEMNLGKIVSFWKDIKNLWVWGRKSKRKHNLMTLCDPVYHKLHNHNMGLQIGLCIWRKCSIRPALQDHIRQEKSLKKLKFKFTEKPLHCVSTMYLFFFFLS